MTLTLGEFITLMVFGIIGMLVVAFITIYIILAILDLTYYERHSKSKKEFHDICPEYIESEEEKKQ